MAALASLAWSPSARADTSAVAEPSYSNSKLDTRDASGVTHGTQSTLDQRYRLNLDESIFPLVKLGLGGIYDWALTSGTTEGLRTDQDSRRWTAFAHLRAGDPILSGALDYDRSQQSAASTTAGVRSAQSPLVREVYAAALGWRPADLPTVDLRLSRAHLFDEARLASDQRTDELFLSSTYRPSRALDLGYSLRFSDVTDQLHLLEQKELVNAARFTWSDKVLSDRGTAYVSYSIANRRSDASVTGTGGVVPTLQVATAGLSLVEAFPATPDRDTLTPNPALVDGETTLSAGLDLGFAPTLAGDLAFRDLGASFGVTLTSVNAVYVYVDRQLPPEVARGVAWAAYTSNDNVLWTPLPLVGPVAFGLFANRFEIPVARTDARFVKVVAKPLTTAVTTDRQWANILVTEAQFLLVLPGDQVQRHVTTTGGQLSATGKYVILRNPVLTFDSSLFVTHQDDPARLTWSVLNGLSFSRRLTAVYGLSARVDRSDTQVAGGHESENRASAALSADFLPTLGGGLTYSGRLGQTRLGTAFSNGVSAFARADLYTGVSVSSNASLNVGQNELRQTTNSTSLAASATLNPHPTTAFTGAYALSRSSITGGLAPAHSDTSSRVDGTVSFTPAPALYLAAGASHYVTGGAGTTLANVGLNLSPFPRGDLQARFSYSDSLDTSSSLRQRIWGPSLRWNIRRGWFADASYTVNLTRTPALETTTKTFFVSLVLALR